jgi:hypothetical protein
MNYFTKKLSWLLMSFMLVVSGNVWAETVDVLNQSWTGMTGTTYDSFTGKTATSTAVYAGNCAGGNTSIQLRSNNSNSGIVTTVSGGMVKKIAVEWNSSTMNDRTLNVYGKNTAYESATDLYNSSKQGTLIGTIVCGTSTELTISDEYEYIGLRSNSGAMYLTSISITWDDESAPAQKEKPVLTFSETTATATLGESFTAPTLTTEPTGLSITYSSSNTDVATVDETTGAVTIVAAGKTTITATSAETEEYDEGTASYTITVSEPQAPTFDIIDLTGKTESITFSDFSNAASGYATAIQGAFPASDGNAYEGWDKTDCMYNGKNHKLLQMKSSTGKLTSPTIKSNQGIKVIVTYGSLKGIKLTIGEETVTGEAGGGEDSQPQTIQLTSTATETTFTIQSAGSNATYVKSIEIVPLIGDEPDAPTFTPAEGEYTEAQAVTITAASGCTIFFSIDGTTPSIEYTAPIIISETTTIKAIAKSASGASSDVATATYTISIPVVLQEYANIKEMIDANTSATSEPTEEFILHLNNAQVLYVGTNDMYVKDATGAVDLFKCGLSYTAGQILNGTIKATYQLYKNLPEIASVTENNLTATDGSATPEALDVEEITLAGYVCNYITTSGTFVVDGNNYYISDGANQIPVYNKFKISDIVLTTITNGANVTATGIVVPFNGEAEIALTELVVNDEPIVELDTYENIAATIEAAPTGKFILKLTDAQVLYSYNKDTYVKDATGAILFYSTELPYTEGQVLNGTITVTYTTFKGIPEINGVVENNLTATEGTATPTELGIDAATVEDHVCDLVTVTGTLVVDTENDKYYVSDGTNQVIVYNGRFKITEIDDLLESIQDGATVTATGIIIPQGTEPYNVSQIALTALEETTTQLKGDANGDGSVDISDVVAVVNYILNGEETSGNFVFDNADVDNSKSVDISDVVGIVNIILNGE